MTVFTHFINGKPAAAGPSLRSVEDPSTGERIGEVAMGGAAEIDAAVAAARRAWPAWRAASPAERATVLRRVAAELEARHGDVLARHAAEVGTPLGAGAMIHGRASLEAVRNTADLLEGFAFEEPLGSALVQKLPVGVVGAVTPWNVPLQLVAAKAAPAMAAGCTIVVKPSELAPGSAALFAEAAAAAGLPPGVFNLVHGDGAEAGEALMRHPGIDMVSFTGSLAVGRHVGAIAGGRLARTLLELGGKSASVALEDSDVAAAAARTAGQVFLNSGQGCIAWSRLIVPRARLAEATESACAVAAAQVVGDPRAPGVTMGPLISARQRERVAGLVEAAVAEGAVVAAGGADRLPGMERGHFFRPTVLSGVSNAMRIARDEVFGPVLCVIGYDTEAEAAEIADDSAFGLHGAVFGADTERALAFARGLRTGQVMVNAARFEPLAPFGGFRASGIGRQGGPYGLAQYLELKAIHV